MAHVLRPAGADSAESVPPLAGVLLERGLRALWIVGAALLLLWIWEVNVNSMTGDAAFARLLRGAMHAIVILLVIELLWHVMRTWIDRRLAEAAIEPGGTPEAIHRRARVRTLLPIARNVLLAVLAVMAVLMALSALGIEVGPLIAGAGVVGVAIGFGSQTLVKDVISGVFFLLDDAFRVGEYIESGSTRGTVEGLLPAVDQAAASSRLSPYRAVRIAGEDHQLLARLGDRQGRRSASPTTPTSTR